jgi:cell division protein FtsI (penicillin-binding protein 3)
VREKQPASTRPTPEQGTRPTPEQGARVGPAASAAAQYGTLVVDVEQGGILVPSFAGKSVRAAIELAESAGLDLEIVGSGLAEEQSPAAGTHVAAGTKITVKFAR